MSTVSVTASGFARTWRDCRLSHLSTVVCCHESTKTARPSSQSLSRCMRRLRHFMAGEHAPSNMLASFHVLAVETSVEPRTSDRGVCVINARGHIMWRAQQPTTYVGARTSLAVRPVSLNRRNGRVHVILCTEPTSPAASVRLRPLFASVPLNLSSIHNHTQTKTIVFTRQLKDSTARRWQSRASKTESK
jgi:mRNA-degrading endonuclease toxin of MazEF toxin-antitoxin module